jgi:hypothetical protein
MKYGFVIAAVFAITAAAGAATSVPYFSDFEANDGGWVGTGDWEYGIPVGFDGAPYGGPEPVGGYSGDYCWGTVIGGAHSASTTSVLSQEFDLRDFGDAFLSFQEYIDSGGNTFDTAKVFVDGNELYLSDGGPSDWRRVTIDLSGYTGVVNVEFEFATTSVVERVGWYIDDVGVTPEPASLMLLALGALIRRR